MICRGFLVSVWGVNWWWWKWQLCIEVSEEGVVEMRRLCFPVGLEGKLLVSGIRLVGLAVVHVFFKTEELSGGDLLDGGDGAKLSLNGKQFCTSLLIHEAGGLQKVASMVRMSGCCKVPVQKEDILTTFSAIPCVKDMNTITRCRRASSDYTDQEVKY